MCGFSEAEDFVQFLLTVGAKHACDESNDAFANCEGTPGFFDKQKFKRGQEFYQKHKLSMFLGMYFSLVAGLAVPWFRSILKLTNMSGTPKSAYKRYVQTGHYVAFWYTEEFNKDSSFFRSLSAVRKLHNDASNRAAKKNLPRITQRDMALTQIGFFGFLLMFPEKFGIHYITDEDLAAVLHVWRVIGYMLGVDDRFNVCNGSVQETREIVSVVFFQVVLPNIEKKEEDFVQMAEALLCGLKITPFPDLDVVLTYYFFVADNLKHKRAKYVNKLSFLQKLHLGAFILLTNLLRYSFFIILFTYLLHLQLWLQRRFVKPHFRSTN